MTNKSPHERHLWEYQAVRDSAAIAAIIGMIWLGYAVSIVTVPLLAALMLAYLIEPLLAWLQHCFPRLKRTTALGLVIGVILATLALIATFTVPPLVRQAAGLVREAPQQIRTLSAWLQHEDRPEWLRERLAPVISLIDPAPAPLVTAPVPAPQTSPINPHQLDEAHVRAIIRDELSRQSSVAPTSWWNRIASTSATIAGAAAGLVGGLVQVGIGLGVGMFAFVVFSSNWPHVLSTFKSIVPASRGERTFQLIGRMDRVISSFVRGRLTIAAIVGVLYAVGWTLCGVPYGLLLGLGIGMISIVPYLAGIGLPLAWMLLAIPLLSQTDPTASWYLTAGSDGLIHLVWWKILLFPALVNFVVQSTEDYVLTPMIQGKATDLHPVAIMVAVIAGGSLMGLYGMLLAVPAAACVRILGEEVLVPRLRRWTESAAAS